MLPFYLRWTDILGMTTYFGADNEAAWDQTDLSHGVLHPGIAGEMQRVVIENRVFARRLAAAAEGAPLDGTPETVVNLKFYLLPGNDRSQELPSWPGSKAGVQFSFDAGITWTSFSDSVGNPEDPATWILVPGNAVCLGDPDGTLGPFPPHNRATIGLRVLPPSENTYT